MSHIQKKWISIEELAEYLDVSAVTIRFWIRSGKDIPAVRIGRQWRFKIEDVDEWIQSGRSNFNG
ncbi:helix-turn-helix domain-containing protein [uncultured Acidaminococcus sp.]|jgi:excisionase family DNA binding protein|uniref:helix-turn-helix domain-containing protein n=1 Tax=uncultured Acidaminococcus sp. TaxID=352152 RepID=UPI00260051D9|nr:helix-turn-helix domain-containing protein [uncultured Acidaminococcus sp.]